MDIATEIVPEQVLSSRSTGSLLILIPAFNEGRNVAAVVRDTIASVPGADVVVVDDGSSDGTAREAAFAGAKVIRLPVNLGYGAALQAGYMHAVRRR